MGNTRGVPAALALLFAIGAAEASEESDAALRACRAEVDDSRRLNCYDRELDRAQAAVPPAATVATAAPVTAPVTAPAAELTAKEQFGRKGAMTREEADRKELESRSIGELQAKVAEIWTRGDGLMIITLDNGQEWRQNRPDSFFRLKTGDPVKIQPAAMNSFLMSGPSKRSTRVTRVK
jgi:hypothetical protein